MIGGRRATTSISQSLGAFNGKRDSFRLHFNLTSTRGQPRGHSQQRVSSLGDALRDLFDFESWAPKSSRAWRLGTNPTEKAEPGWMDGETADALKRRIETPPDIGMNTFIESSDDDISEALTRRLSSATVACEEEGEEEVTGETLRSLIFEKWGKTYDISFVRRDIPGKSIVTLNVLWPHLEQRSFPMSEEDYLEKLDGIAYYLRIWNQVDRVVAFLNLKPKAKRGLPARPVVGIAVPIQLDLSQETIDEYFAR